MKKLWLIALNEFRVNVYKKSFILTLLSVPLVIGLNIGLGITLEALEDKDAPVGYLDPSGLLLDPLPPTLSHSEDPIQFIPFQDVEEARTALEAGRIQAFYLLPPDYPASNQVELVYLEEPGRNATSQFYSLLQVNLLKDQDPAVALRASQGSTMTIRSPDGLLEFPAGGPSLGRIVPLVLGFAFVFLLMMSSGYLMGGVVEEKQNRTMEVLVTSVSESQMIAGKVWGVVAISLVQFLTWVIFGVIAVFIGGNVLGFEWFQNPALEWGTLLKMLAIAIPSYITASALMFAMGSTVAELQEGQSVGALFFMLHMIPLYAIVTLIEAPNSGLAVVLSLAPFTSLLTIGFRSMFMVVPIWQFLGSVLIQWLCALGALWFASKAFRLGMLLYGKRLRLKEILQRSSIRIARGSHS